MSRKYAAVFCVVFFLLLLFAAGNRTAVDPEDFAGLWYSSFDQSPYLFQEGLITCSRYGVALSEEESICGAYAFCKGSVCLFARGIPGLEREKQLYLIHKDAGSFLCEHPDGRGTVYFIRSDS